MVVILIGPPGAGKGTQAERLKKQFQYISTGDLFRTALRNRTPLGLKVKGFMERGELVPDSLTVSLVEENLATLKSGDILFDGFPRNVFQAEALDELLKKRDLKVDRVLFLEVSDSVVVQRLSGRRHAVKSGRIYHIITNPPRVENRCDESGEPLVIREDDKKEVILSRLEVFKKETKPLLEFYESRELSHRISAEAPPEQVFQSISKALALAFN